MKTIKQALETLLQQHSPQICADPIQFVYRYSCPLDQEIAGFFAAQLAYGRVSLFLPVLTELFNYVDEQGGPRKWVENITTDNPEFPHLKYRFNKKQDFLCAAFGLQSILKAHGSLKDLFEHAEQAARKTSSSYTHADTLLIAVQTFQEHFTAGARQLNPQVKSMQDLSYGLRYWLSSPKKGGACKRWNMYLRWMVRQDHPDLGIWDLDQKRLRIPLDRHIIDLSQMLGWTTRKSSDHKMVTEVTESLRRLCPEDPIRYDFALAHLGISGQCEKEFVIEKCIRCPLFSFCIHTADCSQESS